MTIAAAFIMPHPPVILPEIGMGQEKKIQSTIDACENVARMIAEIKPDTIVLVTPHSTSYEHYFHISPGKSAHGDFGLFGARNLDLHVNYDEEFVKNLSKESWQSRVNAGQMGEKERMLDHGTMIPLIFVNKEYKDYKLVRVSLSGLPREENLKLGRVIAKVAEELHRKVVLIASGDLSHKLKDEGPYGFAPEGPRFDQEIMEIVKSGNLNRMLEMDQELCQNAAECGLGSFLIMAGALEGKNVETNVLSYEGPFGVGYGVASLKVLEPKVAPDPYVMLARYSLEGFVRDGVHHKLFDATNHFENLPPALLNQKAGVFVSLKKDGKLRGCIGTIGPVTGSIAEEILENAISAGVSDLRFPPVTKEELNQLVYSVDVLSAPEPIASKDELDVNRYGVIVSSGRKRGLLLPNLEGVDSVEDQIFIALSKAGIGSHEEFKLERFEVIRHK